MVRIRGAEGLTHAVRKEGEKTTNMQFSESKRSGRTGRGNVSVADHSGGRESKTPQPAGFSALGNSENWDI